MLTANAHPTPTRDARERRSRWLCTGCCARAGVGGAGRALARGCCRTAARASVGRAGCALAAAARCASIGHACCARLLREVRRRALRTRARARAETGSGKGVRARGAYTRARLARRMTATMMASGPASGERTIMTVLPRLLREVRRRALRARTRAKESVRGTLKPHSQAARSRCTLKPHAQAARSGCTLKHCVCASVGGAILEDNKDRCRSMAAVVRERQKHGVTRFGPPRSNRVRQVPRDVTLMRRIWLACEYGLWRRSPLLSRLVAPTVAASRWAPRAARSAPPPPDPQRPAP